MLGIKKSVSTIPNINKQKKNMIISKCVYKDLGNAFKSVSIGGYFLSMITNKYFGFKVRLLIGRLGHSFLYQDQGKAVQSLCYTIKKVRTVRGRRNGIEVKPRPLVDRLAHLESPREAVIN